MKNKRIELMKKSARKYVPPSHAHWDNGIRIYHDYTQPHKQAWWDDTGFIRNGVYHLVLFTHPRHQYFDYCDSEAYKQTRELKESYLQWKDKSKDMLLNGDYIQKCKLEIYQRNWCREIHICAPFEVINAEGLHKLCDYVKNILNGNIDFQKEWSEYQYNKDSWVAEFDDKNV